MTPFSKIFASLETVVAVRGEASAFSMGFEGSHLRKRWGITFLPRRAMRTSLAGMFLTSCSTICRLQVCKTFKTAPLPGGQPKPFGRDHIDTGNIRLTSLLMDLGMQRMGKIDH